MSSMTLCLFSVALCNIGNVDQLIFGHQQQQPQQQQVGYEPNIFNGYVNAANLGQLNQQPNHQQNHNHNHNKKPRPPHQSPCKARFQYVTDGNEWKGIIKFKNFDLSHDTLIEAEFVLPPQRNVS